MVPKRYGQTDRQTDGQMDDRRHTVASPHHAKHRVVKSQKT